MLATLDLLLAVDYALRIADCPKSIVKISLFLGVVTCRGTSISGCSETGLIENLVIAFAHDCGLVVPFFGNALFAGLFIA